MNNSENKINDNFIKMLHLFSCGALGISPKLDRNIDINEINRLALSQGVSHIVYLSISRISVDKCINIDAEVIKKLKEQTMIAVTKNTRSKVLIHNLLEKFNENNLKYCLIKGEVLSYLYNNPDCRISNDTDILISIKDKKKIVNILKIMEFEILPLYARAHHIVAKHPIAGVVELHFHLYGELVQDVWFDNEVLINEEYREIKAFDGKNFKTLGVTDGLIFITLHYIKHFLCSGVGVRQLMDVLLYMNSYYNEIKWERFNNIITHLKFKKFIDNSIGIGVIYLNIDKNKVPDYCYEDSIIDKILYDFAEGGLFGKDVEQRVGFNMEYTKERFYRFKKENYSAYIKKWWRPIIYGELFPSIKKLSLKFPYLKKIPVLYPVAWGLRIINLFISYVKRNKSMYGYFRSRNMKNDIIKNRMELIRELDMI